LGFAALQTGQRILFADRGQALPLMKNALSVKAEADCPHSSEVAESQGQTVSSKTCSAVRLAANQRLMPTVPGVSTSSIGMLAPAAASLPTLACSGNCSELWLAAGLGFLHVV